MQVLRQKSIPVVFEEVKMQVGFRADLIIENKVLVEIKSMESLPKIAEMQIYTYLKLTDLTVGLLINFNSLRITDGLRRIVNNYVHES